MYTSEIETKTYRRSHRLLLLAILIANIVLYSIQLNTGIESVDLDPQRPDPARTNLHRGNLHQYHQYSRGYSKQGTLHCSRGNSLHRNCRRYTASVGKAERDNNKDLSSDRGGERSTTRAGVEDLGALHYSRGNALQRNRRRHTARVGVAYRGDNKVRDATEITRRCDGQGNLRRRSGRATNIQLKGATDRGDSKVRGAARTARCCGERGNLRRRSGRASNIQLKGAADRGDNKVRGAARTARYCGERSNLRRRSGRASNIQLKKGGKGLSADKGGRRRTTDTGDLLGRRESTEPDPNTARSVKEIKKLHRDRERPDYEDLHYSRRNLLHQNCRIYTVGAEEAEHGNTKYLSADKDGGRSTARAGAEDYGALHYSLDENTQMRKPGPRAPRLGERKVGRAREIKYPKDKRAWDPVGSGPGVRMS